MSEELFKPNALQSTLWGALMEAKYKGNDLLKILDETVDSLHDQFYILEYKTNQEVKSINTSEKRMDEQ